MFCLKAWPKETRSKN